MSASAGYHPARSGNKRLRISMVTDLDTETLAAAFEPSARGKRGQHLALLWQTAQVLLTADDPHEMLRSVFRWIREECDVDAYLNFIVNDRGDALQLASCEGIPAGDIADIQRIAFGQAICGSVALQRAPIVATGIQDSTDANVQLAKRYGIRACACNPLLCRDELLGTLSFATRNRDAFHDEELEVFRVVSQNVAVAYERIRLIAQLREADRRKDEFLATLAHELRNPLAPIRAAVDFLRLRVLQDADQRSARDIIDRQVQHMTRLVEDLLDVSRVTLGRIELTKTRATIGFVLGHAFEASRPVIESKGHSVVLELTPEPLYVDADLTRLAQVFVNLLNNAAKYTPAGGRIRVTARQEHGNVVVRLRDNGIGIPSHMLSRVFELFGQVDSSTVRGAGGLGIGLTLARRLIELHGGEIEAHSDGENQGSEFIVRLPLVEKRSTYP
jgi:signal transduction histidine kinase